MRKVEDYSLGYDILRPLGKIIYLFSHRHFTVYGLDNVPRNEAVILAPNHQNALLDSLSIVLSSNFQPVFLGRADMFKKKLAAKFLSFFKITPVYRIRDGKDTLDKNQDVFDNSVAILNSKKMLVIYPEAAHNGMKSMLMHKKAIPRIVFLAAETSNYELDIKIVPVGINYTHYYNFRQNVTIRYGKPISSKAYYSMLKEDGEAKTANVFRNDLFEAIRKLVVHVDDKPAYELYDQAFELAKPMAYEVLGVKHFHKHFDEAEQLITTKVHSALLSEQDEKEKLVEKAKLYKRLKTKLGFSEDVLRMKSVGFFESMKILLILIVLIPFGIYGAIANGWLYYFTRYPYRKKIKDKQFLSTISFGLSFFLFPIWTLVHFSILLLLFKCWIVALLLVVFSYPDGILAWELGQLILRTFNRFKYNRQAKSGDKTFMQMLSLRNELSLFFQKIFV